MAKDILKEAIADAKAVREVALANAKAALEEAFTPKLQSMLSSKLSEELDETNLNEKDKEDMQEMMYDEDKEDMEEMMYDEDKEEKMEEETNLDEEIDLEEILNELELEEAKAEDKEPVDEAKKDDDDKVEEAKNDEDKDDVKEAKKDDEDTVDEAKDDKEEKLDEARPIYKAEEANDPTYKAEYVNEGEEFDLDALLEEIQNLDEKKEDDEVNESEKTEEEVSEYGGFNVKPGQSAGVAEEYTILKNAAKASADLADFMQKAQEAGLGKMLNNNWLNFAKDIIAGNMRVSEVSVDEIQNELNETKNALKTIKSELNEVNLLNSKLLYVNRIFKANTLDEAQKLRVVESLDKAASIKESKLIYETIKDTFNISKSNKVSHKKSIKENLGMASKAAGTSTAPKKEVISESNDMVARFKKLANIKINE